MPEPESDGSQLGHGEIVEGEAIEASADVSELLELVEETLDEVAFFVGPLGIGDGFGSVGFRGNEDNLSEIQSDCFGGYKTGPRQFHPKRNERPVARPPASLEPKALKPKDWISSSR
jgi:hypothetical protein